MPARQGDAPARWTKRKEASSRSRMHHQSAVAAPGRPNAGEPSDEPLVSRPSLGNLLECGSVDRPPAGRTRAPGAVPEARAAERRLAFLAEASAHLAGSLDYETTLSQVARSAVPEMADWCVVDTLDEDGSVRLLAVAHVDAGKEALVRELRRRYPPAPQARYGLQKVLASGRPELYPDILPAWRQEAARDAEHLRLMEALDARSSMCVPLRARGQTLGAMTFVCAGSGRRYGPSDVALAQDLADRCALALDNARLHSQLQETMRAREAFLASLAHDLKTPLTASLGYAQLVRREAEAAGRSASARRRCGVGRDHRGERRAGGGVVRRAAGHRAAGGGPCARPGPPAHRSGGAGRARGRHAPAGQQAPPHHGRVPRSRRWSGSGTPRGWRGSWTTCSATR